MQPTRRVTGYRFTHVPPMSNFYNHKAELADAGKMLPVLLFLLQPTQIRTCQMSKSNFQARCAYCIWGAQANAMQTLSS